MDLTSLTELVKPLPLASSLWLLPLIGALAARRTRTGRDAFAIGLMATLATLGMALLGLVLFDPEDLQPQFADALPVLPFAGYQVGVDGINILFVLLAAFLALMLVLYAGLVKELPPGRYVALLLTGEAILLAMFLSRDLLLFWLLACLEVVPTAIISMTWGTSDERRAATFRYVGMMVAGLVLMLAGILILAWQHAEFSGHWSFALSELLALASGDAAAPRTLAFWLILIGLLIRMGQFPFHAWLPPLAQYGTLATAGVFLIGSKLAIFAMLRFLLPILPDVAHAAKTSVAVLGVIGIFYGALLALVQVNLRRLLAFAAVSNSGMLLVGVFCLNREGLIGTLLLSLSYGVAASGLLLTMGLLRRRAGSALLPRLGGLFDQAPLLGLTFLLCALSTMAMPGTPGFDAAHLLLEGTIETHDWELAVAVAVGNVLTAAFLLWAFQRIFLGDRRDTRLQPRYKRPALPEIALTGILCLSLVIVGFYTDPCLTLIEPALTQLSEMFQTKGELAANGFAAAIGD